MTFHRHKDPFDCQFILCFLYCRRVNISKHRLKPIYKPFFQTEKSVLLTCLFKSMQGEYTVNFEHEAIRTSATAQRKQQALHVLGFQWLCYVLFLPLSGT